MAVWQLAEERLLSGKGVLQITGFTDPFRQAILYADVVRPPRQRYVNLEYNPPKSFYARIAFCRDDYVVHYATMEADRQLFDTVNDVCGQTLIAVKCAYDGILESFDRQNAALGLVVLPRDDLIQDYANLRLAWNKIRVVCYKDCAIRLQLWVLPYDVCDVSRNEEQPPPESPPPPTPVPPGQPIGNISPPYDDASNDGGDSVPNSIDEFEDPLGLPGEPCSKYLVVIRHNQNYGTPTIERDATVYGEVTGVRIVPSGGANALQLECRGWAIPSLDIGCQSPGWLTIFVSDSVALTPEPEIISFTPV